MINFLKKLFLELFFGGADGIIFTSAWEHVRETETLIFVLGIISFVAVLDGERVGSLV